MIDVNGPGTFQPIYAPDPRYAEKLGKLLRYFAVLIRDVVLHPYMVPSEQAMRHSGKDLSERVMRRSCMALSEQVMRR